MDNKREGVIFIPILVAILLIGAGMFSNHLDKQVIKYDQELEEKENWEEKALCGKVKYGPYISFMETQQVGLKTKP